MEDDLRDETQDLGEGTSGVTLPGVESSDQVNVKLNRGLLNQPKGHRSSHNINQKKDSIKKKASSYINYEEREHKLRLRQILLQIKQERALFAADMEIKQLEKKKLEMEIQILSAQHPDID